MIDFDTALSAEATLRSQADKTGLGYDDHRQHVLLDWARQWHLHRLAQASRARKPRRGSAIARLVSDMAYLETGRDNIRERFDSLPSIGDLYDLTIRPSDADPDVMEWDDLAANKLGEISYRTFRRWLNTALRKRGCVQDA